MRFELPGIREAFNVYPEGIVKKAARSALNKVGPSARQTAMDQIRKIWSIPEAVLRERMGYVLSRIDNLEVVITFSGESIPLIYFNVQQFRGVNVTKLTKKGAFKTSRSRLVGPRFNGVQLSIIKGENSYLPHAFLARMESGHVGVFVRKGRKRYPIRHKAVISAASMLEQERVQQPTIERIEDRLMIVFPHELEFYLNGGGT
jgi:Prophage minor tail protein Z (GPZ)